MINRIETVYSCGSNKWFSSSFCLSFQVQQETPEEGLKTYQTKHENNNKDDVNSLNILITIIKLHLRNLHK